MHEKYNLLFSENSELFKNDGKIYIEDLKNYKCINLYVFSEMRVIYENEYIINEKLLPYINENFDEVIMYDKYIDKKFKLNLYIMDNKNVK
jgi:hypothetical protein